MRAICRAREARPGRKCVTRGQLVRLFFIRLFSDARVTVKMFENVRPETGKKEREREKQRDWSEFEYFVN